MLYLCILFLTLAPSAIVGLCAAPPDKGAITATLVPGRGPIAIGLPMPRLKVSIHNGFRAPIVLRGVSWKRMPADARQWLRGVYGSITENADGTITHSTMAQQLSQLRFETGFIPPGGERVVEAPVIPQSTSEKLIVRYATVSDEKSWKGTVFLRNGARAQPLRDTYLRADRFTPTAEDATHSALVTTTMKPKSAELPVIETEQSVPFTPLTDSHRLTGGLAASNAAAKAGVPNGLAHRSVYVSAIHTWFFVQDGGKAVALRLEKSEWKREAMPKMDPTVPDEFGEPTFMMLRPGIFDDLVKAQKPKFEMYYNAGATQVRTKDLWKILKRARERNLVLHIVSYNPNGLGVVYSITAGVKLSSGGAWIDPPVKPGMGR